MSTPYYQDESVTLWHGDCIEVMRTLPDSSVDSIVTDPPYGLGFMGKEWDSGKSFVERKPAKANTFDHVGGNHNPSNSADASRTRRVESIKFGEWCELWTAECLRVLKPGGHLLAFGGTRTWHRLACAVEDAGFEVRDSIAWLYGSGFPKSLDVSKAIDKAAGAERDVVGPGAFASRRPASRRVGDGGSPVGEAALHYGDGHDITAPATDAAQQWAGWGTALKPAFEPIVVARKPLSGTVAANVLEHGTGALNIDGCRVATTEPGRRPHISADGGGDSVNCYGDGLHGSRNLGKFDQGRWPTNVVLDESQAEALDDMSGELTSGKMHPTHTDAKREVFGQNASGGYMTMETYGDTGGASRFFPTFQSDPCDVCGEDMSGWHRDGRDEHVLAHVGESLPTFRYEAKAPTSERPKVNGTAHPTVKPLDLMRWLVRLVTPPGGTVLEPFAGSGTTVEACVIEGFRCIAIEKTDEYLPLTVARIHRRRDPVAAIKLAGDDLGLFDLEEDIA